MKVLKVELVGSRFGGRFEARDLSPTVALAVVAALTVVSVVAIWVLGPALVGCVGTLAAMAR